MELSLGGKVAIVTGASRGIGAVIAAELAREGCSVGLAARNQAQLDAVVAEISAAGGRAAPFACDLRDPDAPATLLADVEQLFGRIDILVLNAGTAKMGDFLELDDADWAEGFGLKFFAHMRLVRAAWPRLVKSTGSIVIIAGSAGRTPAATSAITGSVNAALLNLTKMLAARSVHDNVQVNAINPGAIRTNRYVERLRSAVERSGETKAVVEQRMAAERGYAPVGEPRDIADLVCFIVSDRGKHLRGSIIDIDGGKTRTLKRE